MCKYISQEDEDYYNPLIVVFFKGPEEKNTYMVYFYYK